MQTVCVFCGSSAGFDLVYKDAAYQLGQYLANQHIKLVYGGASVGLMGVLADAALAHGGEVHGFIPSFFSKKEIAHDSLTKLSFVDSMHERKLRMADLSDGFIALPGGFGTMDEFFEVLTWLQLDLHQKPVALLNVHGFFNHLIRFFDQMTTEGFVKTPHRDMIIQGTDIPLLISQMESYQPPRLEKWLNRIKS